MLSTATASFANSKPNCRRPTIATTATPSPPLHGKLDAIDAWTIRSRAASLLHGLGFSNEQLQSPVRDFSGGWRMRLNLAQALVCRSDLLLLDEPTNHLDLDAVIWLERWLKSYPGTLVLISHDRDFPRSDRRQNPCISNSRR